MQTVFRHNKASIHCMPLQRSRVLSSACILKVLNKQPIDIETLHELFGSCFCKGNFTAAHFESHPPEAIHTVILQPSSGNTQAMFMLFCKIRWGQRNKQNASYSERGAAKIRAWGGQEAKHCGVLAWRLHWCIPRHLVSFSTKRSDGNLEFGHHLPEQDRRKTLWSENIKLPVSWQNSDG